MDRVTNMQAFNAQLFQFMDHLLVLFPQNLSLKKGIKSLDAIKRMNPTLIIKVWYNQIYLIHRKQIEEYDVNFFLNDFTEIQSGKEIMLILDSLKQSIDVIGQAEKQSVVEQIYRISMLSKMYNS
jgi:lipopolysaccharide biosynthesis regulator YciM